MFDYEFIKWKTRINTKTLSILFTAVYILGLIPMLVLGFYDWPSADDFSMALQARQHFVQYGGFFGTVWASLVKSYYVYTHYEGYFFSIILTCISPSVFGEGLYFLTPFFVIGMLTFGVCYFFDALFVRAWKLDKHLSNAVCMLTLIMMTQCINGEGVRAEAFYWYSGAVNYTFTFGMAFFWLGLLFRIIYDENNASKTRKKVWACIWGFLLGGANYLTALELAILSVLILFILFMIKRGFFKAESDADRIGAYKMLWLPTLFNLVGFAFACFAPGIAFRSAETQHNSAVKAVLISLYTTFDMMINDMMRWEVIVCLLIIAVISWKMADGLEHRLKHPVMFGLFAYLFVSSNVTPPLYAVANIGAGRLKALAWMEFAAMISLTVFYFVAWMRQTLYSAEAGKISGDDGDKEHFSVNASMMLVMLIAFIFIGSGLCVVPEPQYYSVTSALSDLVSGDAATYRAENRERLEFLQDESLSDVGIYEHTVRPEMLFYQDVTPDVQEWINQATATYYNKSTVTLVPRN